MNSRTRHGYRHGRLTLALVLAAAGSLGALVASMAQTQAKKPAALKLPISLVIYRGDTPQSNGLRLASWGSGTIDEDTQKVFSGTESLKVTTHGMYQGASLMLNNPVDFGQYLNNKNTYLSIAVLPPSPKDQNQTGGPDGSSGGYPGFPGSSGGKGSFTSPGNPGAPPGGTTGYGGYGANYGSSGKPAATVQKNRKLENVRVVLVTTGGKTLEALLPLANATMDQDWKILAIPVALIPNLKADDAKIKEIRLFGDAPATLNVGSIGIVEDPSPITIASINDKTVQRLAKYQYSASASGGITPLVYSWDWNAEDGIQNEAEGRSAIYAFRKASVDDATGKNTDFVVTVTVSDLYGVKAPVKTSFKVHVTP